MHSGKKISSGSIVVRIDLGYGVNSSGSSVIFRS